MKQLLFLFFLIELIACNNLQNNNYLNRNPSKIRYSRHARCRMECRHINEYEIKNILENGTINFRKSDLNKDACHQRYAVEGYAQNEHLRVVFAGCNNIVTVITCIDLDREWSCNCPGDEDYTDYR